MNGQRHYIKRREKISSKSSNISNSSSNNNNNNNNTLMDSLVLMYRTRNLFFRFVYF
jgi:hypothetical protein